MRRIRGRLAIACGCAFATAAFTGAALAGNGHGNDSAPGQQKQDEAAATQPAPSQQAAPPERAQGQQTQSEQSQQQSSPGQAKKEAASSTSGSQPAVKQPGVKPSNSTTHWTHCTTGGSVSSATCTAQAGTPNVNADVSKHYGNGRTAAQIAVGRGAPDGTLITGPGNSQPHKVTACGKPGNKSGGVDVHAIKSYDAAACQPRPAQPVVPVTRTHTSSACGEKTVVTESTQIVGVLHGRNEHLMTNPKSAHFTKHDDEDAVATSTGTKVVSAGDSCGSSSPAPVAIASRLPVATPVVPSPAATPPVAAAPLTVAPVTVSSVATPPSRNAGGVLGASATIAKPKAAAAGGVLGTAAKVAGSTLPFTGFPVWVAVLIALGLIAAGLTLGRRGSTTQL